MGRTARAAEGGLVYHVLNRANAGLTIFDGDGDYEVFARALNEAIDRQRMRLLAYCLMPDHFHLVVWPRADGDLSRFMSWLTVTHTRRWHAQRKSAGSGHLYQGRFKSFPIQADTHLHTVCRYVEGSAARAGLVVRAQEWPWCSLGKRPRQAAVPSPPLTPGPVERPSNWVRRVNASMTPAEEEAVRRSIRRGQPFGDEAWRAATATRLGLESTLRPVGRPRKDPEPETPR